MNHVFQQIHDILVTYQCTFITCYVTSKENPVDGPSQSTQLSLPFFPSSQSQKSSSSSLLTVTANRFPASIASILAATHDNLYQSQKKITHASDSQTTNLRTTGNSDIPIPSQRRRLQEKGIQDPSPITQTISAARPSAYSPHLTPNFSTLRPHCLTWDHLCLWVLNDSAGCSITLSEEDLTCVFNIMSHAWAQSTQESYSSGLLSWHVYCDKNLIPELQQALASQPHLARFVASLTGPFLVEPFQIISMAFTPGIFFTEWNGNSIR